MHSDILKIDDAADLMKLPCDYGATNVLLSLDLLGSLTFRGSYRPGNRYTKDLRKSLLADGYRVDLGIPAIRILESNHISVMNGARRIQVLQQISKTWHLNLRASRLRWIPFRVYDDAHFLGNDKNKGPREMISQPLRSSAFEVALRQNLKLD